MKNARREVAELRGRIVRAVQLYAGTAFTNEYLHAMSEAGQFNRDYPDRAIPRPFRLLGFHPLVCSKCKGEGSVPVPAMGIVKIESDCGTCWGSGWMHIHGIGDDAKPAPNAPAQ